MNEQLRSNYADYIAGLYRYVRKETGVDIPETAKIIANHTSPLSEIDSIIGVDVLMCKANTSDDFTIAFEHSDMSDKQMKAVYEYFELYSFN